MYHGRQQVAQELRAIMLRGYIERGPDGDFVETQELLRDIIRWAHNDPEAARQVMADIGGGTGRLHRLTDWFVNRDGQLYVDCLDCGESFLIGEPIPCTCPATHPPERTTTHA